MEICILKFDGKHAADEALEEVSDVLVAETPVCDQMVELFTEYSPKVVRRNVASKLQEQLGALLAQSLKQLEQRVGASA